MNIKYTNLPKQSSKLIYIVYFIEHSSRLYLGVLHLIFYGIDVEYTVEIGNMTFTKIVNTNNIVIDNSIPIDSCLPITVTVIRVTSPNSPFTLEF